MPQLVPQSPTRRCSELGRQGEFVYGAPAQKSGHARCPNIERGLTTSLKGSSQWLPMDYLQPRLLSTAAPLLRGGSLAAATIASPTAAHASGMAVAPSPVGRRILALIGQQQALEAVWKSNQEAAGV